MGRFIKRLAIFFAAVTLFYSVSFAQKNGTKNASVYTVNHKLDIPLTLGLFGTAIWGYNHLSQKEGLSYENAISLTPNDVWWFDRPATKQDPTQRLNAHNTSDVLLNTSMALPLLLGLDKSIRTDWFDVLLLYGQSHAISSNLYVLTNSFSWRPRPFNYHPDVAVEEKMANESRNSFYSGHVNTAATASFFMAKVYSDYHPQLGNKKIWLFAAATIPPALVGYYRFKAMKHFTTDIMVGTIAGAATGILVPHLHKRKNTNWAFIPYAGKINGVYVRYTFDN